MREVDVTTIRDSLFFLSSIAGQLSMLFIEYNEETHKIDVGSKILSMLLALVDISCLLSINLHHACYRKIELNNKKYPLALCQVSNIGRENVNTVPAKIGIIANK